MKISIITSVYNNKKQIKQAIDSVLSQSYENIEYIIIDGASTDGTVDIIHSYGNKISKFISETDNGIYDGLNKGIQHATGDIIGFLHSDDFYLNNQVIQDIVNHFQENNCDGVYGNLIYVDKNNTNKIIRYWKSETFKYQNLKKGWMPPHPTFFIRREIYHQFGSFDTTFKIAADYNFMLKILASKKIKACYLSQVLYVMRVGGASNKSLQNILKKSIEDLKALKENKVGGHISLFIKNFSKVSQFFKKSKIRI